MPYFSQNDHQKCDPLKRVNATDDDFGKMKYHVRFRQMSALYRIQFALEICSLCTVTRVFANSFEVAESVSAQIILKFG